jgi:hypothetical protein
LLLPGGAKRLNQTTDWSIEFEWDEFKNLLNIPDADVIRSDAGPVNSDTSDEKEG